MIDRRSGTSPNNVWLHDDVVAPKPSSSFLSSPSSIRTLERPRSFPHHLQAASANNKIQAFQQTPSLFLFQAIYHTFQSSQPYLHIFAKVLLNILNRTKMKCQLFIVVASFALSVLSSPHPDLTSLAAREVCNHPGECSWTESGQCEYHCDGYDGFQYMQDCGWGRKRCCCVTAT